MSSYPAPRGVMGRVTITAEEIADAQDQEGPFIRAAREEWDAVVRGWRRDFLRDAYTPFVIVDPDLEMDKGL